jgi:hypothetical protein
MNRIIHVEFNETHKIPAHLQMAGLEHYLQPMMSDIFNWAIHAPADLLKYHIRNTLYKQHQAMQNVKPPQGFEAFLMEVFVYDSSPDAFVPIDFVESAMRDYLDKTGDLVFDMVLKKRVPKRDLSMIIPRVALEFFDKKIQKGRWTRQNYVDNRSDSSDKDAKSLTTKFSRPYGFRNLEFKPKDKPLSPTQEEFKRKWLSDLPALPDVFYTDQKIAWVQGVANDFSKIQEEIQKHRLARAKEDQQLAFPEIPPETNKEKEESLKPKGEALPDFDFDLAEQNWQNWNIAEFES